MAVPCLFCHHPEYAHRPEYGCDWTSQEDGWAWHLCQCPTFYRRAPLWLRLLVKFLQRLANGPSR